MIEVCFWPDSFEFLVLLVDPLLKVSLELRQFNLQPHDLGLLVLNGVFCLFQSGLELGLLLFQLPLGLLDVVHWSATLSQLVGQVWDLGGKGLVLSLEGFDGLDSLFVRGLEPTSKNQLDTSPHSFKFLVNLWTNRLNSQLEHTVLLSQSYSPNYSKNEDI